MADPAGTMAERRAFLPRILADAREDVGRRAARVSFEEMRRRAADARTPGGFRDALVRPGLSLIAEFKRASPSKGPIFSGASVPEVVRAYAEAGAQAISVLTNERYFRGSDDDLRAARSATSLPILRKDFTVDAYQVYEARAIGADAVLLIVAALSDGELRDLIACAHSIGLAALVEAHSEDDVERAVAAGADIIGINNRNLHTFETSLRTTQALRPLVPEGKAVVSESGILTPRDAAYVKAVGVDAILIGESLMRRIGEVSDVDRAAVHLRRHIRDLLGT